jgi:hypothetical protein
MFLAPNIYEEIMASYLTKQALGRYAEDAKTSNQPAKIKNVDQPETKYHKWLEESGKELTREKIIAKLLQDKEVPVQTNTKRHEQSKLSSEVDLDEESEYSGSEWEQEEKRKYRQSKFDRVISKNKSNVEDSEDESLDRVILKNNSNVEDRKFNTDNPPSDVQIDNMFANLALLHWRDKDTEIMNIRKLNIIETNVLQDMYYVMCYLADNLATLITPYTGALDDLNTTNKYNFLFHVLAQGKEFYYNVLDEPEFCLYLLDQYQPLYSFMKKNCNENTN